jgi:hypothetical protein
MGGALRLQRPPRRPKTDRSASGKTQRPARQRPDLAADYDSAKAELLKN